MNNLKIESKPLCIIDGETTGLDVTKDEFVSFSVIKHHPNGEVKKYEWLFNPSITISKEAESVHGISMDDLKDQPKFKDKAPEILDILLGCTVCGHNIINFDLPMLENQLMVSNCGHYFKDVLDTMDLANIILSKSLENIYKLFVGGTYKAHNSTEDCIATGSILDKLVELNEHYGFEQSVEGLKAFINHNKGNIIDRQGKLIKDENGDVLFNFGKQIGKRVIDNKSYASWVIKTDGFSNETKEILTEILNTK